MSLHDAMKEIKEQIEEAKKREEGLEQEEDAVVEQPEEPAKEPEPETPEAEEEKPEEDPKADEKLDDSGYARLRREKAAEKKRADELEARLAELERKQKATAPTEEQPAEPQIDPEISQVLQEHRVTRAEREFMQLETKFKASTPDYDAVAKEYSQALAQSIRIQNPRLSPAEIAERTKMTILQQASAHVNAGYDPIEELYHSAKELGFTGKSTQQEPKEEPKAELKPDMARVAENRKRNAGMAAAAGDAKPQITKQAASEFSPAEWSKLPVEEKRRLMYGA